MLTRVQRRLGQLAGPGAQVYAEDTLLEHIVASFTTAFDDYIWPDYQVWVSSSLDETVGVCVADLSAVKDGNNVPTPLTSFIDILGVYPQGYPKALPNAPQHVIPSRITGAQSLYIIPYPQRPDKVFRVIPYTATGDIDICYKTRPSNIDLDTDLKIDEELIVCAATYLYLADDATNPTATNIALGRLQARERKVAQLLAQHIPLGPQGTVPDFFWSSN